MQKPTGYDEARVTGEYTPVTLGGHYCVIKQVSETTSSTGKPMIVVLFDFCPPDEQSGRFMTEFTNDDRENKKWPFAGTKYIMVNDFQDASKTSRQFKTFCSCVEKSNNYEITWGGTDWGRQFLNKQVGCVYGEEENEYNGRRFMRPVPKYFCRLETVKDAEVPKPKYVNSAKPGTAIAPQADNDGFMNIPDGIEEELPF